MKEVAVAMADAHGKDQGKTFDGARGASREPAPSQESATVGRFVAALEAMFPPAHAERWDRTGLLVGDADRPLGNVAVALDPTPAAVRQAHAAGAGVLLTHHPAFIEPPCRIAPIESGGSPAGAAVFEAASRGVALVNFHTALDVSLQAQEMMPGMLSLSRIGVLEPLDACADLGYGQICLVDPDGGAIGIDALACQCAQAFGRVPRVWGPPEREVRRVVTWTGSAGDAPLKCLEQGIDALICGEVKYHTALDAASAGLALIELGHDVSELPFTTVLARAACAAGVAQERITCLAQDGNWRHPDIRRA